MPSSSIPSGCTHQTLYECQLSCQIYVTSPISIEEVVRRFIPYYRDCRGKTKVESYELIFHHVINLCHRKMIQDTSTLDSDNPHGVIVGIVDMYWSS